MKVLLAGNQWIVRAGIKLLLERVDPRLIISEAEDFETALRAALNDGEIRMALLDVSTPGMDGLTGLAIFKNRIPDLPLVVVSSRDSRADILRAIDVGAVGYISKTARPEETIKALKTVLSGGIYVPQAVTDQPRQSKVDMRHLTTAGRSDISRIKRLTLRQHEVFARLGSGMSNADIAQALGKSEHTVRIHVSAILKGLGVKNRTQAGLLAAKYGYAEYENDNSGMNLS